MITATGREFLNVTDPYGVGAPNSDPECFWRIIRAGELVVERGGIVGKVGRRRVRRFKGEQAAKAACAASVGAMNYASYELVHRGQFVLDNGDDIEKGFLEHWEQGVNTQITASPGSEWVVLHGLRERMTANRWARYLLDAAERVPHAEDVGRSLVLVPVKSWLGLDDFWSVMDRLGGYEIGDDNEIARAALALYNGGGPASHAVTKGALDAARRLVNA